MEEKGRRVIDGVAYPPRSREAFVGDSGESAISGYRRFVTFYFTNFPEEKKIPHFYLRKAFEVCGILENVFVASKRNIYGELYGFVRISKVRDVTKDVVCFE